MAAAAAGAYDGSERYENRTLEGWTIRINKRLVEGEPELAERTLVHLRHQLYAIVHRLPERAVGRLREVPIWVELEDKLHPCMCYHPDRQWLIDNDYHPEKENCVELANARNYLQWTVDQPWMVLHELAHAYHDRVLGFDDAAVKEAYERALSAGKYAEVLRVGGRRARAYALSNPQEFFAEASEAFFGTNDFYPFVRAELADYDPETFRLLERLWEDRGAAEGAR
jgi:hypothetical protein